MEKMNPSMGDPRPHHARVVDVTPKKKKSARGSIDSEERVSRFVLITPNASDQLSNEVDGDSALSKEQMKNVSLENPLASEAQDMEIETLSNISETDTGKTLEPKPKRISDFFAFLRSRSADRSIQEGGSFIQSPTGTGKGINIVGGDGDGPSTSSGRRNANGTETETAENKPSHSSFRQRLEVAFARAEDQKNPWIRLKKAIMKKKYDIYNAHKAMQDLKLDDEAGAEHEDNGSFSEVELDSHRNQPVAEASSREAEPDNINAATMAAEERILSLPYRTHKNKLKKEVQAQIAFCKRQRKMRELQLKANLRQSEKRKKEEIALKMRQNKAVAKTRIQQARFGTWKKMFAMKEHELGGRCREIMAKYRGDKSNMDLKFTSKQHELQRILEEKLLKLEVKKERKQRMLREKMVKEMKAVEDEIMLAKSKMDAEDPENDVLDGLLTDISSVADEDTSGTQAS